MPKIEIPDDFICPIDSTLIKDPVTIKGDDNKHVYSRAALIRSKFLETRKVPMTGVVLSRAIPANELLVADESYAVRLNQFKIDKNIATPEQIFAAIKTGDPIALGRLNYIDESFDIENERGQTPLECAAEKGVLSMVQLIHRETMLKEHQTEDKGLSAMHFAAQGGHQAVAEYLHSQNTNYVKSLTRTGELSIHLAAAFGRVDMLPWLRRFNGMDEANFQGLTPCMLAAMYGQEAVVDYFIKNRAQINAQDGYGVTAIMRAAYAGKLKVVELLLTANANLYGKNNVTPVHSAADAGHKDIIVLIASKHPNILNTADVNGETALHFAARSNQAGVVEYLLSQERVEPFKPNIFGKSPLQVALEGGDDKKPNIEVLNVYFSRFRNLAANVIHTTVCEASVQAVQFLLNKDSSQVSIGDANGNTPLHFAVIKGRSDIVSLLLGAGADTEARNGDGLPPIQMTSNAEIKALITSHVEEQKRLMRGMPARVKSLEATVITLNAENAELRARLRAFEARLKQVEDQNNAYARSQGLFPPAPPSPKGGKRAAEGDLLKMDAAAAPAAKNQGPKK